MSGIIGGRVSKTNVAVNERHRPQLESADAEPLSQSVSQSVSYFTVPPPHPTLTPPPDRLSIRRLRRSRSKHNGTESDSLPGAILNCRKCERQSLPADRVLPVAFCTELLGRDCVRLSGWVVGRWGWGMCLSHPSSYICCRRGVPLPPLPACISGAALDDAEHSLTDLDFCSARIRERSAPPPRALAPRGGPPPDHAVFASTRLLFRLGYV